MGNREKHGKTEENVETPKKTGRIRGKHRKTLENRENIGKHGETEENVEKQEKTGRIKENIKENTGKQKESGENTQKQGEA